MSSWQVRIDSIFRDQHQDVDDTAGASVAVVERVNRLELMVGHGHAHQWIQVVLSVDEALPGRELLADEVGPFGWRIHDLPGCRVGDPGSRNRTDSDVPALQFGADPNRRTSGEGPLLEYLPVKNSGKS